MFQRPFALCAAALAAILVLLANPVAAQTPATPPAAAAPTDGRLFADSRLIVRDRFSVEVVGQGPDLVLIPGLAASREAWRATAEHLRGRYRLHLVQIAGFAGEPARANAQGDVVVPTAEGLDAYIREQGHGPVVLVGHALGGAVALYIAAHDPAHVRKVMVVDSMPFYGLLFGGQSSTPQTVTALADSVRNGPPMAGDEFNKTVAELVGGEDDRRHVIAWNQASDSGAVNRALADDIVLDLRPSLSALKTPVTVLYPDNLPNGVPAKYGDEAYAAAFAAVPHKTLTRIANSRHFVMLDQPQAFQAALDGFLTARNKGS